MTPDTVKQVAAVLIAALTWYANRSGAEWAKQAIVFINAILASLAVKTEGVTATAEADAAADSLPEDVQAKAEEVADQLAALIDD
jgi:hypothetical protein